MLMRIMVRLSNIAGRLVGGGLYVLAMVVASILAVIYGLTHAVCLCVAWPLFTIGNWVICGEWRCPVRFVFHAPVQAIQSERERDE